MTEKLAYSIDEAADLLSISRSAMKDLLNTGQIKKKPVGRRVLIPRWALDEFLSTAESATAGGDPAWATYQKAFNPQIRG